MALSNIFREPRREITESAVGLALSVVAIGADYAFALWLQEYVGAHPHKSPNIPYTLNCYYIPWPLGMGLGICGALILCLIAFITHAFGDSICNALQRNGIHLRPRNRPNGQR